MIANDRRVVTSINAFVFGWEMSSAIMCVAWTDAPTGPTPRRASSASSLPRTLHNQARQFKERSAEGEGAVCADREGGSGSPAS